MYRLYHMLGNLLLSHIDVKKDDNRNFSLSLILQNLKGLYLQSDDKWSCSLFNFASPKLFFTDDDNLWVCMFKFLLDNLANIEFTPHLSFLKAYEHSLLKTIESCSHLWHQITIAAHPTYVRLRHVAMYKITISRLCINKRDGTWKNIFKSQRIFVEVNQTII